MKSAVFLCTLLLVFACQADRQFPEVVRLSSAPGTAFSPTLEHPLDWGKNQVYASSLCYAWDEIEKKLDNDVQIAPGQPDLALLAASESFRESLTPDEISTKASIEQGKIYASAFFRKSLPFEMALKRNSYDLDFEGVEVESFGFDGEDVGILMQVQLLYYRDDSDFALKLLPKDPAHEIVLCKTPSPGTGSFLSLWEQVKARQKEKEPDSWRNYILKEDVVSIPVMAFNIEHNYSGIEGNSFTAQGNSYEIQQCYQRTAFLIDEKGAEVESEAEILAAIEAEPDPNRPQPKHLIFDGPFLLLLKRTDSPFPYFAFWVANTEWMIKR